MSLTFKSSRPEERVVIERAPNGRQRVARAVQSDHNARHWNLCVEHPDGQNYSGTYNGGGLEVVVALAEMLNRTEHDYQTAKANGDRRPQPPYDHNRPVEGYVPIRPIPGRG